MKHPSDSSTSTSSPALAGENRLHRNLIRFLLLVMIVEWVLLLLDQRWLSLFLVTLIITTLFAPFIFKSRMAIELPAELHLTAVIFIFASFYLGEIQDFYHRFWWWDIALHGTAGLLMGILGFLLVYLLNESKQVDLQMTPGFIAFFAFTFTVSVGTVWEIFEFGMDLVLGTNMQKPMLGDLSGLTDTMWDMIVNAIGGFLICFSGWWYLRRGQTFFVKEWIRKFIQRNPDRFRK
ncbi:MAG: hypothetical protein WD355_01455 [Balneolaceae bacterium]